MNGYLSNFLKDLRLKRVANHCRGSVIDVGCYHGDLCDYLDVQSYTGTDIDTEALQTARKKFPGYVFQLVEEAEKDSLKYDCVVSVANIGLVNDQAAFMKTLFGFCKDDGLLIISCPPPFSIHIHKLLSYLRITDPDFTYKSQNRLVGLDKMKTLAAAENGKVLRVERFLFGMNQLFVLSKNTTDARQYL